MLVTDDDSDDRDIAVTTKLKHCYATDIWNKNGSLRIFSSCPQRPEMQFWMSSVRLDENIAIQNGCVRK